MPHQLLTIAEAATTLRLHPVTLRALAAAGTVPAVKIGRAWRFVEIDLLAWARAHYRCADAVADKEIVCRSTNVQMAATGGPRSTYQTGGRVRRYSGTAHEDRVKFRWLDAHFRGRLLHSITRDEIQAMGKAKAKEASRPTANRYLALVRAVLRQAAGPWQWIAKAPAVTLYPEANRRMRWLNKEEVSRLLNALPTHQRQPARFALATGLRQDNVLRLQWPNVDLGEALRVLRA